MSKKSRIRNLVQYKDLTDEEFDKAWKEMQEPEKEEGVIKLDYSDLDKRIDEMLDKFREDYDLDNLKFNDIQVLRALAKALINLEDYENILYQLQSEGIKAGNIRLIDKINGMISNLRKDISSLQDDLEITRKTRKEEKSDSVEEYIITLQDKANDFYGKKILKAICPECGMMLFDGWFLYPEADNKIILNCNREIERREDDNTFTCPGKIEVSSKELRELQSSEEYRKRLPEKLL